ncbi:MAG: ABC transporter substrate-binding protein [Flavobacteriaceae bacterium]|nr:ABC transporter substrate-binding protein [Flavobacteriaceae bacterium]
MFKKNTIKGFCLSLGFLLFFSCQNQTKKNVENVKNDVTYAKGFALYHYKNYTKLVIKSPYPDAKEHFDYYLVKEGKHPKIKNGITINIPIKKIVATSTTHIPMIDVLNEASTLVGFPNLKYISTPGVRQLIDKNKVRELGNSTLLNTEVLLNIKPDVVIGFSMQSQNKMYETIKKKGIPVILNGDWLEQSPLGRAEWVKLFGALYNKEKMADSIFTEIVNDYNSAQKIAKQAKSRPTVLSGILFNNIWNLPAGNSFEAQFLKQANTQYYWQETSGKGSLSLSFESVLNKAQNADFWFAPGAYTSFNQLKNANLHYAKFKAFKSRQIYTFALTKGATGGFIYYEESPLKPNIILKDIIKITHPELLPNYTPYFLKKLN